MGLRSLVDSPEEAAIRARFGVSHTAAKILAGRGFGDDARTKSFLDPRLSELTSPDAMADRAAAAERLAFAVRSHERIVIFGDYDVDGITSAAILTLALRAFGADVFPLCASRFDGGYGFSERALARVLAESPRVVVTCDCGSSDAPRLEQLRQRGIDTIVIDHHLVPKEPLPVLAFLNPHRPECGFVFKHLASCGLALSMAAALRALLDPKYDVRPLLDLVALGSIADVVPLIGDNRALVRAGLTRLATAPRPGLEALTSVAGLTTGMPITGEDVAFRLAPRINAPGRLRAPDDALALMLETDHTRARALAERLHEDSLERRKIERQIVDEAMIQVDETGQRDAPCIVVAKQGWHPGVVGIVAARLVDRLAVPAIAIALEGDTGRGSVRGPQGSRLYDALVASAEAMVGFGGHQAAAGVHVESKHVEKLRELFADACRAQGHGTETSRKAARAVGSAEVELDERDEPAQVIADLQRLEPCGEKNRAPVLRLPGAKVRDVRIMKEEHLRLLVEYRGRRLDAFGYGLVATSPEVRVGDIVDIEGRLKNDTFRGRSAVELRLTRVTK